MYGCVLATFQTSLPGRAMRIMSFPWKRLYSGDDEERDGREGGRQSGEPEPGSRSILGENRVAVIAFTARVLKTFRLAKNVVARSLF